MKKVFAVTAAIMLVCMVGGSAFAGWTVVSLHPAGATWWPDASAATGVSGGQQVGYGPGPPGGVWNHARLWSGTAESYVDLNPAVAFMTNAYAVSGGQQVGVVGYSAALWSGTAASWVDLNPAGARGSCATGVSGGQQVGYADSNNYIGTHAALWSGTKESWVDLHPAGTGADSSSAAGISGGQQVGDVQVGWDTHASLWSGTAASWVDLNPVGAHHSYATGVSGGLQVGYAYFDGRGDRAGLWSGTAESWVSLSGIMPAGFLPAGAYEQWSSATSVEVSAGEIWVAGGAFNSSMGRSEAVLWHYTAEPISGPVFGISNRAAYDPIISSASAKFSFKVWGKVTILGGDSFSVDDGSGTPVTVVVPGFSGIANGDYASAKGKFSGEGSNRVLNAQAFDAVKLH